MSDYYGTPVTDRPLNDIMEFGLVVYSDGDGNVSRRPDIRSNEVVYQYLDDDGQCIGDDIEDLYSKWTLLQGFTGQHGYNGPVLHPSEFIGGGLERHIRERAGFYVAIVVDGMYDDDREPESIGWAIGYRAANDGEEVEK